MTDRKPVVLTAEFFKSNRQKLKQTADFGAPIVITANSSLQLSGDRAFPFAQDSNFWYLSGISEPGYILVIGQNEDFLIAPSRDKVRKTFEGEVDPEKLSKSSGIDTVTDEKNGWSLLAKLLNKSKKVATVDPPPAYIASMDMFTNPSRARLVERLREIGPIKIINISTQLAELRMIKSQAEIRLIQQAIDHTVELFDVIEKARKNAKSENALLAEAYGFLINRQLEFAYEPIIASGQNATTLHYSQNNQPIDKKGPLLIDIGVRFSGYAADLTRTVFWRPSKRQKQVYRAVLEIQEFAVSLLKPGTSLKAYEESLREFTREKLRGLGLVNAINNENMREFYPHSTSHFLGIDVHDAGDYSKALEPGMVLTVEPGIYIEQENIGIRLEDDIVITKTGNSVLSSRLPKSLWSLTMKDQNEK